MTVNLTSFYNAQLAGNDLTQAVKTTWSYAQFARNGFELFSVDVPDAKSGNDVVRVMYKPSLILDIINNAAIETGN
ncbi:MAG: hypothetical protein IT286_03380 [Proteobacteria bacterium]|jgi:hypothetical protein|nr:hypothetical protein [Pseudomonadota bacterium]